MDTAVINIEDGINGYVDLVQHVLKHGRETAPRGMKTREIEDAVVRIKDVYNTLPMGINRGTVPGIGAVEACQLIAGKPEPELLLSIAPQFKSYTNDDGVTFHGNYGARTNGQYEQIIERLKADPDSRQAVVTLWNPELDLQPGKRDYPCTVLHQFRIRDNKLNMSTYMRSNDVWLGAAYDFFQFTQLQVSLASVLQIDAGTYTHHVGSLHIYEQHYEVAEQLKYADKYTKVPNLTGRTWEAVKDKAKIAMLSAKLDQPVDEGMPDVAWFANAMSKAIEKQRNKQ